MEDRVEHQRREYERFFLAELRRLLDLDAPVEVWSKEQGYAKVRRGELCIWKGIGVEEVRLDTSGPEHEAVVLLRELKRPECLFGWRAPTVEPSFFEEEQIRSAHRSIKDAAEIHAMVMSANLEEDLCLTNFPQGRACSPGEISWL